MKKVEAIIKPHKLDEVKAAMQELGVSGMTAWEVQGFGQHPRPVHDEDREYQVDFVPKVKIEIVVDDDFAEAVEQVLVEHARTGKAGDGKVFIYDCASAVRIRTGERGALAV